MLFPTTFISASEKIGVGLKKQETKFFLFQLHPQKGSPILLFWLFFLVQNEGIFSYLGYEIPI